MNTKLHFELLILLLICIFSKSHAMTLSGPITANNVTVSGDVTISSITVSSLTISSLIKTNGIVNGIPNSGRILQVKFSSTTIQTTVSTSSWNVIYGSSVSINPINSNDYVQITLTGSFCGPNLAFLTIYRYITPSLVNLGDSSVGLLDSVLPPGSETGVEGTGISFIDRPGTTSAVTYAVYIRSFSTAPATFPCSGLGFLLLEEIAF